MKLTKTLVAAAVLTSMMAAPAFAAKNTTVITNTPNANEALSTEAPAPANYDPTTKSLSSDAMITPDANPIIVLDPGHGGTDPGAVGNGLQEDNMNLDIATRSKNYMVANYPASVYMTRTTDTTVSLDARTTYANNVGASFFVSFHCNSYSTSTPNGLETYYYPGSTNGQRLATNIYDKLKASYATLRGVKSADYYVLHYTNMPAALGETGFVSNPTDAANLGNATFRQTLAQQYSAGMHLYWWGY